MADKIQVNYHGEPDTVNWFKSEAARLRWSLSATLDAALKFWREYIEREGDDQWKP